MCQFWVHFFSFSSISGFASNIPFFFFHHIWMICFQKIFQFWKKKTKYSLTKEWVTQITLHPSALPSLLSALVLSFMPLPSRFPLFLSSSREFVFVFFFFNSVTLDLSLVANNIKLKIAGKRDGDGETKERAGARKMERERWEGMRERETERDGKRR